MARECVDDFLKQHESFDIICINLMSRLKYRRLTQILNYRYTLEDNIQEDSLCG